MTRITIIGLGEAGSLYARGLAAAGADVRGYDRFATAAEGLPQIADLAEAVAGADLVLSLVWARSAVSVAEDVLPLLGPDAVFADLNTASPGTKTQIARLAAARGIPMADVAVLAPVPREAERTPLLTSGTGAPRVAALLGAFGVPVEVLPGDAGDAAQRKLLRSVFMKGMAAVMIEALTAARAADAEEWLRGQMAKEFGPDGEAKVERILRGTYRHAVRREQEVRDALAGLDEAHQPADMTRAATAWYARIVAETAAPAS